MTRIQAGLAAVGTAALLMVATPAAQAEGPDSTGPASPDISDARSFTTVVDILTGSQGPNGPAATTGDTQPGTVTQGAVSAALTAKSLPVEEMGPSKWQGRVLRHPEGGRIPKVVTRWANVVREVMRELKIPDRYLEGILAQIQQESFGDPKAVNDWDSNAAAGDPSKGLLQVIGSTYKMHAKKDYRSLKYQDVPYTNLYAALKYVKVNYGMGKFSSWNAGANHGY